MIEKGRIMTIDIYSGADYPANVLSNFYPHPFEMDGVRCESMEGFLQSLKTKDQKRQAEVCALSGKEAKKYFRHTWNNLRWKLTGTLYWKGKKIKRKSSEYQLLVDRAYELMTKNAEFRRALLACGDAQLVHSIGINDPRRTVLTEREFVSRLERIRSALRSEQV